MTSSGFKRGLAVTAVSAMALTGVGLGAISPASADSIAVTNGAGNAVVLQAGHEASIKNDGTNTTVTLAATGQADVKQVQFQYKTALGATFQNIGTPVAANPDGYFTMQWTPPTGIYNTDVTVRAQALGTLGTTIGTPADATGVTVSSNIEAVSLADTPDEIGLFNDGVSTVGMVKGTTSGDPADVRVNTSATAPDEQGPADGTNPRSFADLVDFGAYTWDTTDPKVDETVITASAGAGQGDDAKAVKVYQQKVTTVTATPASASVPTGKTTSVTVKVADQKGNPIAGAHVRSEGGAATTMISNSKGEATFTGVGAGTSGYFVDLDNDNTYDPGVEFRREVTITSYAQSLGSLTASTDKTILDQDETAPVVKVVAKDQNGAAYQGRSVAAKWTITPFDGSPVVVKNYSGSTDVNGEFPVPFDKTVQGTWVLSSYVDLDGTPGQTAGDVSANALTIKSGEATVVWTSGTAAPSELAQFAEGTRPVVTAKLVLADGTALAKRDVTVSWTDPTVHPAIIAAQADQPAGTTRTSDTTATTKTGADGTFGVALADPKAVAGDPTVDEGTLTGTPVGNGDAVGDTRVQFLKNAAPAKFDGGTTIDKLLDGLATPGRPATIQDVVLENSDNAPLAGVPVTITVDHGFFTTNKDGDAVQSSNQLVADPAAADGADFGEWKGEGTKSLTVKTNTAGQIDATVAIEKDAGFDDDGLVDSNVTYTVAGVSKTIPVHFTSEGALNLKDLKVALADSQDASLTKLPKASNDEQVNLAVYAHDQFGNLVGNVPVALTSTGAGALLHDPIADDPATPLVDESDPDHMATTTTVDTNYAGDSATYATGGSATQQISAKATGVKQNRWKTHVPATVPATYDRDTQTVDISSAAPAVINWYAVDLASSTFTLTHDGSSVRTPGSTVVMTYTALDQEGAPIDGEGVDFYRSGPDTLRDGDVAHFGTTGASGTTNYVFQGTKPGTAVVTAFMTDGGFGGDVLTETKATDTIRFAAAVKRNINPGLTTANASATRENLTVTRATPGATVRYFRIVNGTRHLIGTSKVGPRGNALRQVADLNGNNKGTYYRAYVNKTSTTFGAWTPLRFQK